jgi:hypothetical protein
MLYYNLLSKFPYKSPNYPKAKKIPKLAFLGEKSPKLATLIPLLPLLLFRVN